MTITEAAQKVKENLGHHESLMIGRRGERGRRPLIAIDDTDSGVHTIIEASALSLTDILADNWKVYIPIPSKLEELK